LLYVERVETTYGFDFTEYSEKGFLITPEKYLGDYESVGILSFSISSEAKLEKLLVPERIAGPMLVYRHKWNIEKIDYKEVLELAYKTSTEMGGDAITNFKIDYDSHYYSNPVDYPSVAVPKINVTGFVIKRK